MELGVGINMTKEGAIGRGLNVVLYIPANLGQGEGDTRYFAGAHKHRHAI